MTLDVPTMLAMIVITNLVMAIALWVVAYGRDIPGLKSLAWGMVANTGIYALYGLQGRIPEWLAISLPNTLGSLVMVLLLRAALQLRGAYLFRAWMLWPLLAVFVASTLLLEHRAARIIVVNGVLALQEGLVLWALLRQGGIAIGRGRHILAASTTLLMLMFAFRCLAVALGWLPATPVVVGGILPTVTYLVTYLAVVFIAFGFVLVATELSADQSHRLAMEDALTGLPNRRAVLQALARHCSAAHRNARPLTVLLLDIDHFKQVNDQHGHPAGDEVLRRIAHTIRQRLRAQDMAGRFGGEEFLVLLPDTTPEGGLALAEALREAVAATAITIGDKVLHVTASVGLHGTQVCTPDHNSDLLVRGADAALYAAKEGGRNRTVVG
ncbi:MAG: GGDEF domain-containing protein [Burkholderiales bacterium]|nr:GGDEF domain-containing protein [Burkholderiales bacterium]